MMPNLCKNGQCIKQRRLLPLPLQRGLHQWLHWHFLYRYVLLAHRNARPDIAELDVFLVNIFCWPWKTILGNIWFPKIRGTDRWITLMYRHKTLIVILNFTKIINWFLKSDWLITMLFQGQQRCWPRNHVALGNIRLCHRNPYLWQ